MYYCSSIDSNFHLKRGFARVYRALQRKRGHSSYSLTSMKEAVRSNIASPWKISVARTVPLPSQCRNASKPLPLQPLAFPDHCKPWCAQITIRKFTQLVPCLSAFTHTATPVPAVFCSFKGLEICPDFAAMLRDCNTCCKSRHYLARMPLKLGTVTHI